ncbi:Threonine-phosphate decarboxylase [Serratia liquefaciens]|nr:Threonine-phosphate decarboxylase [Serratia liquefaciens]
MALLKSAHGGNIREAAALLGIAPGELLDFSANINPLGCLPRSGRRSLTTQAAPNATLTSSINSCIRRWLPTISCRRRISSPATAKLNRSSPSSTP